MIPVKTHLPSWAVESAGEIQGALANNPYAAAGILFRDRVAATEHGYISEDRDKELLVLVDSINPGGHCYGHVVKTYSKENRPIWVALLVNCLRYVDAPTVDLLFRRFHYATRIRGTTCPTFYQTDLEDVFAIRDTFNEACSAMAEIVRRFRYELRVEWWNPEIIWTVEPEGKPNLRYLDLYGFGIGGDENGGVPPEPTYGYPAETEA